MRGSNGVSDPLAASVDSAPVTSAAVNSVSAANRPASALAVENCVPLSSASPSLAARSSGARPARASASAARSEEHTSELQSLMRISYDVFCLKKKKANQNTTCQKI